MLNRYPLWKYIILIIVISISLLYALPNIYSEDPAVQITSVQELSTNEQILNQIKKKLQEEKIAIKYLSLKGNTILVCFNTTSMQIRAKEVLVSMLNDKYIVTLNFTHITPLWLSMLKAKPIKLGLDLRGGVHFLIKVDIDTALNNLQEKNINSLSSDLHERGIIFSKISKEDHYGISIAFCDKTSLNQAKNYLTMIYRDSFIYVQNGKRLSLIMTDTQLKEEREFAVQQNINILRNRVNQLGIHESLVQRQGADYIVIEIPGIQDTRRAKEILGATATLEFRLVNTDIDQSDIDSGRIPSNSEVKYTQEGQPIVLYKTAILTGDHIIHSTISQDEYNRPQVNVSLDKKGGEIMYNFTNNNIGKLIATLFVEYTNDDKKDIYGHAAMIRKEVIINVANIQSRLHNSFRITGINNQSTARQLSLMLRTGSLIAPIQIIEERIIGPTMGIQNIKQGLKACLASLVVSIIFMTLFYKKFGLIASSALITNLVMIIGIMSMLSEITLTMPGIAGIALTLVVAIDANILINERIKEEFKNGCSIQQAINKGYKNAFSSIFDANITTLIKALILYAFGTNVIKSFAVTTIIGIVTSMFTAIIGTRAIVNLLYGGKKIKKLPI